MTVALKSVDRIEVTTLIDNFVDVLLADTDVAKRPALGKGGEIPSDTLLAEHGLSLLVTVYRGGETRRILMDTGYSGIGVLHNLKRLEIDTDGIEAVVLSHAHMDHTGCLDALLAAMPGVPLLVHPDAFCHPRFLTLPDGSRLQFPRTLDRGQFDRKGVRVVETRAPALIAGDTVAVTGEVPRQTAFEKGMPNASMIQDGEVVPDPIADDQSLVLHLAGKGLVVISGCSHAGIVNTVNYAMEISGIDTIHAVMGGFHLSGPMFEPIIDATIAELKRMAPKILVPMHCTGRTAMDRIAGQFPDAFELNSVGTKMVFS